MMRIRTGIPLLILMLGAAGIVRAEERKPWQWTNEERIAARTDASLAHARVLTAMQAGSSSAKMATTSGGLGKVTDVIDGSTHPELFMPHELFKQLIREGYVGDTWRDVYDADDLKSANLPPDFWEQLEEIAAPYIADLQREHAQALKGKTMNTKQLERLNARLQLMDATLCRDRAEAFRKASERYGPALMRFMYEQVAPAMSIATDDPLDARALRAREEGCPK